MSTTELRTTSGFVSVGDADLWYEQRGQGPDVLLIAGLSDPVEAWELQLAGLSAGTGSPPSTTAAQGGHR